MFRERIRSATSLVTRSSRMAPSSDPRLVVVKLLGMVAVLAAASPAAAQESADSIWRDYLARRVARIERRMDQASPAGPIERQQLLDMLGLDPLPARGDLQATVTGTVERDGVTVEKLHFRSLPGLYVTADLYRPSETLEDRKLPAVLYLCGHGQVKRDGISYGNKTYYQHHGWWLARHGILCLVIDSLQLGEIEGIHHGTYRHDRWWWITRGYTPAGVEAWNCLRAIDYLESRPDVDPSRIGCTGRSGGGAYSWWIAAIDDRIRCAVPVAGITDLRDHVVHDKVEGHCDCMFFVNLYGWDYPRVAELVAPRPLMIANTDRDPIFPLGGVTRTHAFVERAYRREQAETSLALLITPGGHDDTQDLQIPTLRWLRKHLTQVDEPITLIAAPKFLPEELKVFERLPDDEINSVIDEHFVPAADPIEPPADATAAAAQLSRWREGLRQRVLAAWPEEPDGGRLLDRTERSLRIESSDGLPIELIFRPRPADVSALRLVLLDERLDPESLPAAEQANEWVIGCLLRGSGETVWPGDAASSIHFRRRLALIGESLESGRVWDLRQSIRRLQTELETTSESPCPVTIRSSDADGWIAALTAVFDPSVKSIELNRFPVDRQARPVLPAFDRVMTPAELVVLAASSCRVTITESDESIERALADWNHALNELATSRTHSETPR
jgi:dienelactone hydrolase